MLCLINLLWRFLTTRAVLRAFALISAGVETLNAPLILSHKGPAWSCSQTAALHQFSSHPSHHSFLCNFSPPAFNCSTSPPNFVSGAVPCKDASRRAPTPSQCDVGLAGTSSRGAAADAQREFSPASAHGNVRLYTAESANTAGLRGLFHSVCCFTLNPSFHLLYLRGRSWQALLQGELLQRQRCCPSLVEDLQPHQHLAIPPHTLLTLTSPRKHFPALSAQLQPGCPFTHSTEPQGSAGSHGCRQH